jgi:hypothetical protein
MLYSQGVGIHGKHMNFATFMENLIKTSTDKKMGEVQYLRKLSQIISHRMVLRYGEGHRNHKLTHVLRSYH